MAWLNTPRRIVLTLICLICLCLAYFLLADRRTPSSSDAFLDTYVIEVKPEVSGNLSKVAVKNEQWVKKGDLLFSLDPRPYEYATKKAEAELFEVQDQVKRLEESITQAKENVEARIAEYEDAKLHYEENKKLFSRAVVSKNDLVDAQDRMLEKKDALSEAEEELTEAYEELGPTRKGVNIHLLKAEAVLQEAIYKLEKTDVVAPSDGYVTDVRIHEGSYAHAGETQMAFVVDKSWWITANIKENNLGRVRPGQSVDVSINLYPGKIFKGEVESIGWGIGKRPGLPDNYLPFVEKGNNWVHLAQRFPVRVRFKEVPKELPLRAGSSAIVTIYTEQGGFWNGVASLIQKLRSNLQYVY